MRRWKPLYSGTRCDIGIVIKGNYIQPANSRRSPVIVTQKTHDDFSDFWKKHSNKPLSGRNLILASFCPEVICLLLILVFHIF